MSRSCLRSRATIFICAPGEVFPEKVIDGGRGRSLGPDWIAAIGGAITGGGGGSGAGISSTINDIDFVVAPPPFAQVMLYEVDRAGEMSWVPVSAFSPVQRASAGAAEALHAIAEGAAHEMVAESPCLIDVGVTVRVRIGAGGITLRTGHAPYVSSGNPLLVARKVYALASAINGLLYCRDHSYSVCSFFWSVKVGAVSAAVKNNPGVNDPPWLSCWVVADLSVVFGDVWKIKGSWVLSMANQSPSSQLPATPFFLNARPGSIVPVDFLADMPTRRRNIPLLNCSASAITIS